MRFDELNKDNFLLFAIKFYENPTASTQEEFEEDLKRFKYVKRWLKRYHDSGDINSHLLLNHIIIILNCWDDAAIPMFFHKIESTYWPYLKAFLTYLDKIPHEPVTSLHFIEEDQRIVRLLQGTTDGSVTGREKAKVN